MDHASLQITRERNQGSKVLPSLLSGVNDKRGRVPEEDDSSEGSGQHHAKLVAPGVSSNKEVPRSEHARIADLERQLSESIAAQTERDRRNARLTDELAQKSALLEQAEAKAAEAKERTRPEQRELLAKLDDLELLLTRDQALDQAQSALQIATSRAAEANERSQRELAEVHAKLDARESKLAAVRLRLADAEDGWAKSKAEVHAIDAKLETRESELAAVRLRLADAEVGWAKSKAEADTLRASAGTQAATGLVNMDVDQVMSRLLERVRTVEAEIALLRGNEKSIEDLECSNEG